MKLYIPAYLLGLAACLVYVIDPSVLALLVAFTVTGMMLLAVHQYLHETET